MPTGIAPLASSRFARALAAVAAFAVVVTGLTVGGVAPTADAATGTVTGTVFRDFNSNGVLNTGAAARSGIANDIGLAGVTVKAYDRDNVLRGTATSIANGTYSLTATNTASNALRVEFSGLPTGYQPSAAGTSNGTTIQFTTVGATGVNLGVNAPEDYSKSAAPVVTAIQYSGLPSSSASNPAVVATPYSTNYLSTAKPASGTYPNRVTLATFGQVGAVWGTAFRAKTNALYVAATYKRQSGLGTLGLGAIYRVNNATVTTGTGSAAVTTGNSAATVSTTTATGAIDVTALGINVGTAQTQTNAARGLAGPAAPAADVNAFANAGKVGIGGIALSPDGNTLYFVNLFDKKVYAIDLTTATPTLKSTIDLGLTSGQRPWALNIYRDKLYVGYVTTGETGTAETANPGQAASAADVRARVMSTSLSNPSTWTTVLNSALDYAKGDVYNNTLATQAHRWNTWTDTWDWAAYTSPSGAIAAGSVGETATGGWQIYPQPVLSGLYFDEGGFMSLGFADRTGIQGGNRNYAARAGASSGSYETGSSGDILIAAPQTNGSFTLERNGSASTDTTPVVTRTSSRATNAQGPGTGEFYSDSLNASGGGGTHQEVGLGSLAGIRGTGEVISTEYDPLDGIRLAGIGWLSTANGNGIAGYEQTQDPGNGNPSTLGTFQKGGGLGSVQLLAEQAPIEIGNRTWFDADQDGIQDADEPALSGVTVQLLQGTTVIATRTTDANGNYYFSSDLTSANYAGSSFTPNGGTYTVKFITPTTGNVTFSTADAATFGTVPWSSVSLTTRTAGSDTSVDSNPLTTNGEATYTAGAPGVDDHTIDAGYKANASYTIEKLISANGGSAASGQEFSISTSATDFRGASYGLGANASTTLTANQKSSAVSVPAGTKVQVSETGTSAYRSAVVNPSTATLVTVGTPFAFTVTNELHKPGQFSIKKAVTGAAASAVDSTQEFTVKYTYPGLATPGTLTVKNNGVVVTSTAIPFGTVVTLSEDAPTGAPARVKWNTPTWSGTGITDNGNGTASLTIGDDTTIAATLTNPTSLVYGNFSVTKVIGSDAASSVPGNFEFTVQYSLNGGTSWTDLVVTKNNPTATVTGVPAGTQVLIREVTPGNAASDVEFGTPVFSGTGVTNASPNSSFTIPADSTRAVTLTNPTTRLYGKFSVTKNVTGGAKTQVDPGKKFTVNFTYSGQSTTGSFQVADGEVFSSEDIPRGTVVTITEVTPTGGLPTGSSWGTPVLKVGSTTLANGSTITIGSGTLAVTLENPTVVTAGVDIEKGDGTGTTISHDADTMADAQYYTPGSSKTIVFRVTNNGTDALRQVALSDAAISGGTVTGLTWTLPNGTVLTATPGVATQWTGTFGTGTETFKPGEVITGTATLTVTGSQQPHVDRASVSATGVNSGTAVSDSDNYNALSGGIQVIKYDGEKTDPAVKDASGNWITPSKSGMAASQNADTSANAVEYPVDTAKKVRWVVTNTGTTTLTNLTLADVTNNGPSIGSNWTADLTPIGGPADYNFATSGPYTGVFAPGASFFAEGKLTLPASSTHKDTVTVVGSIVEPAVDGNGVPTGAPKLSGTGAPVVVKDAGGSPLTVTDNDAFHAKAGVGPFIDIEKGDGTGTSITHDADLMSDGQAYTAGEQRSIVFRVTNTGDENLRNVVLRDVLVSGGDVSDLKWTLPDGTVLTATPGTATQWTGTFGAGTESFKPGEVITGKATLTVTAAAQPHVDKASATAVGAGSGKTVTDSDSYNAFTGAVQVIKYDGDKADPAVKDASGNWIIPSKSAMSTAQNADTTSAAVDYPVNTAKKVRWVVTNTGTTTLTNLTLKDVTGTGPSVGTNWTADLSPIGGPSNYSFVNNGTWNGSFAPGTSFFAEGTLTLAASQAHTDTVTVVGEVAVPAVDAAGTPTGAASVNAAGQPIVATDGSGAPITVTDNDKFNAKSGVGPIVDIVKGDGTGTTVDHNANSIDSAQFYTPGETRTIVFRVENTGSENLRQVRLNDVTVSGGTVTGLKWTLPDGTVLNAASGTPTQWAGTFGTGTETFKPGEVITGTATLTVTSAAQPHVDRATVTAVGAGSGTSVTDSDDYNAVSGSVQVIKYDGEKTDPAVKDASGNWITPSKSGMAASQNADTSANAVEYPVDTARKVRWVVTNTGTTTLTNLTLVDVTNSGASIGADWTADLTPIGGPADYSFVDDGPYEGVFAPGASFFAEGTLTLAASSTHRDTVTVRGDVVTPAVDSNGLPTGAPKLDASGDPVVYTDGAGDPIRVTDNDAFHAKAGVGPFVDIEKGDGTGTTITRDADLMSDGRVYTAGDSRTIVFTVTNTGDENLRNVVLRDALVSGNDIENLEWTLPDNSVLTAVAGTPTQWTATFGTGTATFKPGEVITGKATLKVTAAAKPHVDRASVTAVGAGSGKTVTDADAYNAYTGDIQVIKYDGQKADPAVKNAGGAWVIPSKSAMDADQDADTALLAVEYPTDTSRKVRWVVTNTGTTSLTNLTLEDVTGNGPSIGDDWTADLTAFGGPADYSFVDDGAWTGVLPPFASFFAEGTLKLAANQTHSDTVTVVGDIVTPAVTSAGVPNGSPSLDAAGKPIVALDASGDPISVTDNDPFNARTGADPAVTINKGDGTGTTIDHNANSIDSAQFYTPGENRTIVFTVENTGGESLREVSLSDTGISGGTVTDLKWTLPDGTVLPATLGTPTKWNGTFGTGTETFKPGEVITGTAKLTVALSDQPHVDRASVTAKGAGSGKTVTDSNDYNALSGGVQVIKYDGEKADPAVKDAAGNWITPSKSGMAAAQNADTSANAVKLPVDTAKKVRWVVTNTGTTTLTNLTLVDVTNSGASIGADWTADLTPIGGPVDYSFVDDGPYEGVFAPGASFFAQGTLKLAASSSHSDTVTVVGDVVTPAVDGNGAPTGAPKLDASGDPVVATDGSGDPISVTDEDDFHAKTGTGPFIDIEKGDGTGTTIDHDADLMSDGQLYTAGEQRTIVFQVTNTGDEALRKVALNDVTVSGGTVTDLKWTLPNGTVLNAVAGTPTQWTATFGSGTATFEPGEVITGTAKLTVTAAAKPHVDRATVTAEGADSGKTVNDSDSYNAYTGDIQVIKYDGQKADPAVKDASGNWIIPSKSAMDAAQDADTTSTAVDYPVDTARTVRWVVTNTGTTSLTNLTLEDVTGDGPEIGDDWTADLSQVGGVAGYSFVDDGPWTGTLAPGASFFAQGTLTLPASDTHTDTVTVVGEIVVPAVDAVTGVPTGAPSLDAAGAPIVATDASGDPVTVTDADKFNAKTGIGAFISIEKGDGTDTTIDHNADSINSAQFYTPGETRTIVLRVENTGDEDLREVTLADTGISGGTVTHLEWKLPNGTVLPATVGTPTKWTATFGTGTATFKPGEVITGMATLVVALADQPHVDRASVTAVGAGSGKKVDDTNDYNAFTGGIQVIKYDGEKADPAVKDASGNWIIPSKSAMAVAQDADTTDAAVIYPVDTAKKVRWVVTNTGTTTLTNLTLDDVTNDGPSIAGDWTADLSPIGGPSDYSFVDDGAWSGAFAPGESFFAEGTLELGAIDTHADTVTVVGDVVTPAVDIDGAPTGAPLVDRGGDLVVALDGNGRPITVTDADDFNAKTGIGPAVDIEKGDGNGTTIVHDADTMKTGQVYAAGSSRTIVFRVTNTGDEDLRNVELTDESISGGKVSDLTWTFPDGSTAKATLAGGKLKSTWAATVTGTTKWLPGQVITGTATLTVSLSDEPHVDKASVTATGADSDKDVSDSDNYNAYTGGVQVIKYDGGQNDPKVKSLKGNWIMPSKESFDPKIDADTKDTAVVVQPNGKQKVRWVVTNIGTTYLTSIDLADITNMGPSVGDTWTADLSGIGGPSNYSFVKSGTWHGLFAPGESFFAEGELTMGQLDAHADIVKVLAQVVVPDVDPITGVPTGSPTVDPTGVPVIGQNGDGTPYTVNDDDPFTAITPSLLEQAEGNLPFTGVEIQGSLLLALMLLVGGGVLMIVVPRRRRKH